MRAASETTVVRCSGPGDALDAIPWMLGFHPTESMVMLCLRGERSAFGPVLRFDLLDPHLDEAVADHATRLLLSTSCERALLVVYTDSESDDPLAPLPRQDLLLEARRQFLAAGCGLKDAVVVRHGRWWSLLCDDPTCCAPEGTAVEHDSPSAVELAYLTAGAVPPLPSRDALVESLAARPDEAVEQALDQLINDAAALDVGSLLDQLDEIFSYVMAHRGEPVEPAVAAMLIYLAQCIPCRDEATELPFADELVDAIEIWRQVYVVAPADCRPHVGSILAILAWAAGGGAMATSVCESVLEIDPDHALTVLTLQLLNSHIQSEPRQTRAEAEADARAAMRKLARQPRIRGASRGNGGGRRRAKRSAG